MLKAVVLAFGRRSSVISWDYPHKSCLSLEKWSTCRFLSHILLATNNFDEKNFIAWGGFGKVYQGQSDQYGTIAVKRLYHGSSQGQHEFLMEIALLSTYKHENLVSLVGFCDQDGEKILVYKHESNGSLDKYLQNKDLNWIQRLRICLDAARGLKYLHHDVGPQHRVLHRDVKSSNILLNENWRAKISDFGLSKIGPANVPFTFLISKACGTIGYVDPEYVYTGVLTQKSDVYSFGVVLFEVLCGRPARVVEYDDEHRFLCKLAKNHYEKDTLDEIIDCDLYKQMNPASLSTFSAIAYKCLEKCREDRPTMSQVVKQLQKALDYQLGLILWRDRHFSFRDQDINDDIVDFFSSALQGLSIYEDMPIQQSRFTTSSSSSSHSPLVTSSLSWNHNVFNSLRGINVPKSFEELLSSTLQQKIVLTLKDDGMLPHGASNITVSLIKPIRGSQIVFIVSSKNYVNSCWSLNELAYVMESKDAIDQIVTAFFNDMDPLNVRKLRMGLKKVFTTFKLNNDRVESWRKVPRDVTYISHWPPDSMYRKKFITKIIDTISHGLPPSLLISSANTGPIGIKSRMQDFKSQLQLEFGGVHMVGICGTWGSGKSTLASAIYDDIWHEFEGCCFAKNVRAESRMHGLKTLQEKILSDVLKRRKVVLGSIEEGISMMKTRFCRSSVLIILDDVDHLDHLKMLAGSQDWFGDGSRIIITTRNKKLLKAHKISIIYDVRLLNEEEALELFSRHAFGACRPVGGYEELSVDMVSKIGGHPSALISLGSFLCGKDMSEWMSVWARLENIPDHEIVELFKTGDDGVERNIDSWLGFCGH